MGLPVSVAIVHGKTEKMLLQWLYQELRVPIIIDAPNGDGTVSMLAVNEVLSRPAYSSYQQLHRKFRYLEYDKKSRTMPRLQIFPVLDVDGDVRSFKSYKTGDMFRTVPLGKHVVPIYNNPCLEAVLEDAGYGHIPHNTHDFDLFLDRLEVYSFHDRVANCDSTNLDVLIEHLMSLCPRCQNRFGTERVTTTEQE